MRLTYPDNAVVVVAGLPGAGKTTLIRRATSRPAIVVDTDDQRRRGGRASYVRRYAHIRGRSWTAEAARRERLLSRGVRGEGWRSVTVLDRAFAAQVEELHWERTTTLGTTGFDAVGSWGWSRVEVPEAS